MKENFDWLTDGSVVVKRCHAVAVYSNPAGNIVIRMQGADYGDEDSFVVIPFAHIGEVVSRIQQEKEAIENESADN